MANFLKKTKNKKQKKNIRTKCNNSYSAIFYGIIFVVLVVLKAYFNCKEKVNKFE